MDYSFKPSKRQIYPEVHVDNFRDILNYTTLHFPNKIAFCYKSNPNSHDYNKVTYKEHFYDVKNLATMLLKFGLKGEKVALIGHNKYGWPVSYMAISTGGKQKQSSLMINLLIFLRISKQERRQILIF